MTIRKPRRPAIAHPSPPRTARDDDTRPIVRIPRSDVRTFAIASVSHTPALPASPLRAALAPPPPRARPIINRAVAEALDFLAAHVTELDLAGLAYCADEAATARDVHGVLPYQHPAWVNARHPAWVAGRAAAAILRGRRASGGGR